MFCSILLAALSLVFSGHWEGTIHAQEKSLDIAFDLSTDSNGQPIGTITLPAMNVSGLPLSNLVVHDHAVVFEVKGSGGGTFRGMIKGKILEGEFTGTEGVPMMYRLERTGNARIQPPPTSPAIGKEFAGEWTGTLKVGEATKRIGLRLINDPNGTSRGVIAGSDGTEFPITSISQAGAKLTLNVKMVGGSYAGTLNDDGTIGGTWTQEKFAGPLTFTRISPLDRWANAIGGRDKIASVRALYREATVEVAGASGTIKVWHTADGAYRKEESVGSFSSIETFDGTNGMVKQGSAEPRLMTQAEADIATSKAYANSNAIFFAFAPQRKGTLDIDPDGTIVMKPAGGIVWRVTLDPQSSLPSSMVHDEEGRTITVTFASYETVDGMQFEKEIRRNNAVIRFTKTVINPATDRSLFRQ